MLRLRMAKPPATRKQSPLAAIPAIDPALYMNMSKYAGSAVMTVFEQIGGTNRMAEWADENPGDFYTKLFPKIISAPKEVNVSGRISIEDAVKMLDAEAGVDYTEIEEANFTEEEKPE